MDVIDLTMDEELITTSSRSRKRTADVIDLSNIRHSKSLKLGGNDLNIDDVVFIEGKNRMVAVNQK